jgi:hypothetical protein
LYEECRLLRHENEMLVQELHEIQTGKPFYQNGGVGIPVSVNITLYFFSVNITLYFFYIYICVY